MKHSALTAAIVGILALATFAPAQSRVAATVDLKDGQLTPVIATTVKRFEPFKLAGAELVPEIWGLASYDVPGKAFGLGAAVVVGKPITDGWSWFAGVSGQVIDSKVKFAPIVGLDYRF